jgi:hypothetical protein
MMHSPPETHSLEDCSYQVRTSRRANQRMATPSLFENQEDCYRNSSPKTSMP